jgi:shikimate kinase
VKVLDKRKVIEVFEEVLENWKMAQDCVIAEGGGVEPYNEEELEKDANEYKRVFLEALNE